MSHSFLIIVVAAVSITALAATGVRARRTAADSGAAETKSNKQLITRLFDECFNQGRLEVLPGIVGATYRSPNGQTGPQAFAATITGVRAALPDVHYTLDDLVAENQRVAVRWHLEGTQDGSFRGFPPTHRHVTSTGMAIFRLEGGKIVSSWLQTDQLGFLQQIDALTRELTRPAQSERPK